jgi:hypothetical protein
LPAVPWAKAGVRAADSAGQAAGVIQISNVVRIAACLCLLVAGAPLGRGALQWTTTDLALKTEAGQEEAVAVFPFRNTGDKPVRIIALDPSCSCMSAEPSKELYAPGETGEIRVTTALTGFVGHLRRSVAVETDDATGRFYELALTLDIPEPVAISPRFLFWRVGDKPAEKSLELVLAEPGKTQLGTAVCTPPLFSARLTPVQGGQCRLLVKPTDTQRPAEATIRLDVTIAGRLQSYVIYVAVR